MLFKPKVYRDIMRKASLVEKCLHEVEGDGDDVQKKRHAIKVPQREQDSYNPEGSDSKYLRLHMERDLINQKQNNLTVAEYEAQFHRLATFVPSLLADEVICAFRFEEGLKRQIILAVAPFELKTFSAVVSKAEMVESSQGGRWTGTDLNMLDREFLHPFFASSIRTWDARAIK